MVSIDITINSMGRLLNLVDDETNPQSLLCLQFSGDQLNSWKTEVQSEIRIVKQGFILDLPNNIKDKYYILLQLTNLSNSVYRNLFRHAVIWQPHRESGAIKQFYVEVGDSIEKLISQLRSIYLEHPINTPISNFRLGEEMIELKTLCRSVQSLLNIASCDRGLKDLLVNNLQNLIKKRNITYLDAEYIRGITATILGSTDLTTDVLKDILLTRDFNSPEYFIYWITHWQQRMEGTPGLHEQLEMISFEQDRLTMLPLKYKGRFLPEEASIREDIQNFLVEKAQLVRQLMKLRRLILKDVELAKSGSKIRINLPVAQFGLFIRLQIESGLIPKDNVGQLFNFFAAHYSSKQSLFISAESLQKKSTDVEYATAQKMKGQLIWMVNWLNEHYRVSD